MIMTLTNSVGHTYDLLVRDNLFVRAKGFGFKKNTDFIAAGNRWIPLEENYKQTSIEGTILFQGPNAYKKYFDFVQFANRKEMVLTYKGYKTFRKRVKLMEIEKGEMVTKDEMQADIELISLGPWYRTATASSSTTSSGGGKIYDYTYDACRYSDTESETVAIESDSIEECPTKISIYGPCVNPIWRHYVNGILKATGGYIGEIADNRKLVIDATSYPYGITLQRLDGSVVANVYQSGDFGTERFMFFEYGKNRITVTHESTDTVTLSVEVQLEYASV